MHEFCMSYARNMCGTSGNVQGIGREHVWSVDGICMESLFEDFAI